MCLKHIFFTVYKIYQIVLTMTYYKDIFVCFSKIFLQTFLLNNGHGFVIVSQWVIVMVTMFVLLVLNFMYNICSYIKPLY